jgi:hypothetical protein
VPTLTPFLAVAVAAAVVGLASLPAHAQFARTFVSAATGSDANNCDRPTPCRTFQHAHDTTLPQGEITVLDPGGYGAMTIDRAISIVNDGVGEAGVLVSGNGVGITVNAAASDAVTLRGLTVKGIGFGGGNGIVFNTGKSLAVENCVVRTLNTGNGIGVLFTPTVASSLALSNTVVAGNIFGMIVRTFQNVVVTAAINGSRVDNNSSQGLLVESFAGPVSAVITDSIASNNAVGGSPGQGGFLSDAVGGPVDVMLVRSVAANNATGLVAFGAAGTLRVGQSTITGNGTSWIAFNGSAVLSYGDNNINGNGDAPEPQPTIISTK